MVRVRPERAGGLRAVEAGESPARPPAPAMTGAAAVNSARARPRAPLAIAVAEVSCKGSSIGHAAIPRPHGLRQEPHHPVDPREHTTRLGFHRHQP
jgi:hypothetical protein